MKSFTQIAKATREAIDLACAKVAPICNSVKNALIESMKATVEFSAGAISGAKAVGSAVAATGSTVKAFGNITKVGMYDAPRIGINALYYQDDKSTLLAKDQGVESLSLAQQELIEAYHQVSTMLSSAYDATSSTLNGFGHVKNSLYYVGDAGFKSLMLSQEAYEGLKSACNGSFEKPFKSIEIEMQSMSVPKCLSAAAA